MPTLREIWNNVKNIGYDVKINNKDILKEWTKLKYKYAIYTLIDGKKMEVNESIKQLIKSCYFTNDNISIRIIDPTSSVTLYTTTDFNDFFIQHFRIPSIANFELSVLKFLEIAYNTGQYDAGHNENIYDKNVNDFYVTNNLGNPETYVLNYYLEYFIMDKNDGDNCSNNVENQRMVFLYSCETIKNEFDKIYQSKKINKKSDLHYEKYIKYKSKYLKLKKLTKKK